MEVPGVDGSKILKSTLDKWDGGMDWIHLAQERDRWRAVMSAVINLLLP